MLATAELGSPVSHFADIFWASSMGVTPRLYDTLPVLELGQKETGHCHAAKEYHDGFGVSLDLLLPVLSSPCNFMINLGQLGMDVPWLLNGFLGRWRAAFEHGHDG